MKSIVFFADVADYKHHQADGIPGLQVCPVKQTRCQAQAG